MAPEYEYTPGMVEEILLGTDSTDLDLVEYQVDVQRAWAWYQAEYPTASVLVRVSILGYSPEEIALWQQTPTRTVLTILSGAYRTMAIWLNGQECQS